MSHSVDVLALSPHPDDAEIGCAGLLLLARRQGLGTAILDLSEGELATRGNPARRAAEKALAAERLGLVSRESLGLPDTAIGSTPAHEAALAAALRRLRPRLLLAPWREDRHPDHVAAARLAERAVFLAGLAKHGSGSPHRVGRVLHYPIHAPVVPNLVVDVTAVWPERRAVLEAYRSQFFAAGDGAPTPLSDGGFLELVEARARHYGATIGARHGEPYLCAGPLGIATVESLLGGSAGAGGSDR